MGKMTPIHPGLLAACSDALEEFSEIVNFTLVEKSPLRQQELQSIREVQRKLREAISAYMVAESTKKERKEQHGKENR